MTLADIEWAKSLVPQKAKKRDESDSGYGFRFMQARKREGDTYEQALGTLKANKGRAGDWYSKWQNDPGCERQLHRAWDEFEDGTDEEWKIEHSREFSVGSSRLIICSTAYCRDTSSTRSPRKPTEERPPSCS